MISTIACGINGTGTAAGSVLEWKIVIGCEREKGKKLEIKSGLEITSDKVNITRSRLLVSRERRKIDIGGIGITRMLISGRKKVRHWRKANRLATDEKRPARAGKIGESIAL